MKMYHVHDMTDVRAERLIDWLRFDWLTLILSNYGKELVA